VGLESHWTAGDIQLRIRILCAAQEVARQRGDKSFDPGTEWLYAQYEPTRIGNAVGRVALATFLYSDSRLSRYAAAWFRAPNEVYGAEPFFYVDGGEVLGTKTLAS